ncbi:MAG: hypothetical protein ACKOBW_02775 [Planctomycetota bacterium]
MKGAAGLIVALLLGLLGAALNFVYLTNKTRQVKTVSFIGIKPDTRLRVGDALKEGDLVEVRIPEMHAGNLKEFVFLWQDLETVKGIRAIHPYAGGELLRREDYRTPPPELKLTRGQMLVWVAVDSRSFVPDLVNPRDRVTFVVPLVRPGTPTPVAPNPNTAGAAAGNPLGAAAGSEPAANPQVEMIGPFEVAAVGNRLGSAEVSRASAGRGGNEFELGIVVKNEGTESAPRMDAKAMRLVELSRRIGNQGIGVLLHPRGDAAQP